MTDAAKDVNAMLREIRKRLEDGGIPAARLEAELLIGHILNKNRVQLYANPHDVLTAKEQKLVQEVVERRLSGMPLQYITGVQEFMSLDFAVNPHVLIPRPETEMLVELAVEMGSGIRDRGSGRWEMGAESRELISKFCILDLCTGSGAIAVSVAYYLPKALVWAVDISPQALETARGNAARHGVKDRIVFCEGDLFEPLPEDVRFDLILSNPPYIPAGEIDSLMAGVRDFEPRIALDGGADGLCFYRKIAAQAGKWLHPGGGIAVEVGMGQAGEVAELFKANGLQNIKISKDFAGIERMVFAQKGE